MKSQAEKNAVPEAEQLEMDIMELEDALDNAAPQEYSKIHRELTAKQRRLDSLRLRYA